MRDGHVGRWLDAALRRGGWVRGVRRAEAVVAWPRIVGADVARFATAVAYQQGTLIVEVADAETALHLGLQRQRILDAYRERLADTVVRDLRFRVGRAPAKPAPPPAPTVVADPDEAAALAGAAAGLPDELVEPAVRAAHALAGLRAQRRAAGWRPCPVCGTLAEPDPGHDAPQAQARPCATCRRQARTAKVQDAAARLSVAPGADSPALTDDEARVAHWLARARVRAQIADLLPRALADPAMLGALEVAVRCAVALHRGSDRLDLDGALDDVDPQRDGVDARALRALGRHRRPSEVP